MGNFGAAHGCGGEQKGSPPQNLSHISYNDETWQLYLTLRRSKENVNHVAHLPEFC